MGFKKREEARVSSEGTYQPTSANYFVFNNQNHGARTYACRILHVASSAHYIC